MFRLIRGSRRRWVQTAILMYSQRIVVCFVQPAVRWWLGSTECTVAWTGGNDKNIPVSSSTPPITTTTTATIPTFLQGRITLNGCEMYVHPGCALSYWTASVKAWTSALNKWGSLTAVAQQARRTHLADLESKRNDDNHSFVLQIMKYAFLEVVTLENYTEFNWCWFKGWKQRSCNTARQQDVRVWGRSIPPPSGGVDTLQWHWGHLHVSVSIAGISLIFHPDIS